MDNGTILLLLALLILCGVAAIAALLVRQERSRGGNGWDTSVYWHVELWDIRSGCQIELRFPHTCVVGRYSLYENTVGNRTAEPDTTVSREHCMLYEHEGILLAWNMSAVNPACINGCRICQPTQLLPGDRLELGNSVFLVTRVERLWPGRA